MAVLAIVSCVISVSTVTMIVRVAEAPLARLPALQVTIPLICVAPPVAALKVIPAGRVSVTITPVALLGPLLVTVIVYVRSSPATTGSGLSSLTIERSVSASVPVSIVISLFPV